MTEAADPFDQLDEVARALGDLPATTDLAALRTRIDEGLFFVACVGQFKRGKSTLINALVGDDILPTGVIPVTAVVTVVRHGPVRRARVMTRLEGWRDVPVSQLVAYVSEEQNPANAKQVVAVETYVPSALLASGMCLVDTPGLGSVHAGNTAATRAFVPHIDAALVVLGADPPISGDELALIGEAAREVEPIVFVINKADRLRDADVVQARDFTRKVVSERLSRPPPPVLVVSAAERGQAGPTRDWLALEATLVGLAGEAGATLVVRARRRGLARLADRLAREIDERIAALDRPLEESERRVALLVQATANAERSLRQLAYVFRAEEDSIRRVLEARRGEFLRAAPPAAASVLRARLEALGADSTPRREAFDLAQTIAREHLTAWSHTLQPEAEELYRSATAAFVAAGNDFLRRLAAAGDGAFAALPHALEPEAGFREAAHFVFTELLTLAEPSLGAGLLGTLRSREQSIRAAYKLALPYTDRLLSTNSARLTNDLLARVRDSGARLRSEIASMLRTGAAAAERAVAQARTSRAAGEDAVRRERGRLTALRDRVLTGASLDPVVR